jgi:hypothetical protein
VHQTQHDYLRAEMLFSTNHAEWGGPTFGPDVRLGRWHVETGPSHFATSVVLTDKVRRMTGLVRYVVRTSGARSNRSGITAMKSGSWETQT